MVEKIISKKEIIRIPLHIEGLDSQIEGGIPEGHVILVAGTSGSMKSSVVFNNLFHEAKKGKNSLFISLEQSASSLMKHMINLDFKLEDVNIEIVGSKVSEYKEIVKNTKNSKKGTIIISDLGALRKELKGTKIGEGGDWLTVVFNILKVAKKEINIELFVLDSLNALYVLSNYTDSRSKLYHMFERLRDFKVTSYLVSEMPTNKTKFSEYGIEDYLSDGIIMLEMKEFERKVIRQIAVVKMRATLINTDIFSLVFENGKFKALYGGRNPLV